MAGGGFAAAVASLRATVLANYQQGAEAGCPPVRAAVQALLAKTGGDMESVGEALEMAFRQVLNDDLMARALPAGEDILDEGKFGVRALLDLALGLVEPKQPQQGAEGEFNCPGKRTPFLLLEDLFDVLGVAQVEAFWPVVEEREALLFRLFPVAAKSKYIMLKICNSLLRRLSKSHNTAICGRLMMYLSRNWDLSEPSALNKAGAANVANQTVYEDSEEFERQQARLAEKQRREEELRLAVAGQQEQAALQGSNKQEAPIDYALYQSFWGLQERLLEPAKLLQGDAAWGDFVGKAKAVLQAFEGFTVSEDSATAAAASAASAAAAAGGGGPKLRRAVSSASLGSAGASVEDGGSEQQAGQSEQEEEEEEQEEQEEEAEDDNGGAGGGGGSKKKRSRAAMEGAGGEGDEEDERGGAYLGCKYLTNSRLFRLQLHDPLVRVQVLTQVLIVLNYVAASQALTKASAAATTPAASPTAAAAAAAAKRGLSAVATAFTPGATDLKNHARRLIRATPQHGADYLKALDAVLDRERQWLAWKQVDKCATKIERPRPQGADGGAREIRLKPEVKAALQAAATPTVVVKQQRAAFFGQPLALPRKVELEKIKAEVRKAVDVSFESEILERVREANDPENCIDEEYHPRHEPVFCWKALRLAATANPKALIDLETGSLDALCERAAGLKPPPPKPKPMYTEEEEDADGMMEVRTGEKGEGVKPEVNGEGDDADSAVLYVAKMKMDMPKEEEVVAEAPAAAEGE